MRSYVCIPKRVIDNTIKPSHRTNRPNIIIFNHLSTAYRYLVSERKRYYPKTASYHSMSAALYNLDRLIQKYWPNSKGYKETPLYEENENDNYLELWYGFMTKACDRHNNFLDMISVIIFIRDMPISNPEDKREITEECEKNKPLRKPSEYSASDVIIVSLLQRLESARWNISTQAKVHSLTHETSQFRVCLNAADTILKNMQSVCNTYKLNLINYKSVTQIDDLDIFKGNCGQQCISILNDVISEMNNGPLSNYNINTEKESLKNLVKTLTPIYYK